MFFLTVPAATFPWASPHISKRSETSALVGKIRFKHKTRLGHSVLPTRGTTTTHLPALQSPDFPLPSFLGSEHTSHTRTCISTPKQKSTARGPILVDRAETDSILHVTHAGSHCRGGVNLQPTNQKAVWRGEGARSHDVTSFRSWVLAIIFHYPISLSPGSPIASGRRDRYALLLLSDYIKE